MSNLMFCLNATMPIFLTMMLGYAFRKWHIMDGSFVDKMNSFVFKVALPVLVFQDLATVDFFEAWDWKFVVFCFLATLISITAVTLLSFLLKDKSLQGEFIQASYRSSAAIFGIAFIQNIYGEAGMGPLMIVASVPLYNIMAVVVLTVMRPERGRVNGALIRKTLHGIITNPIIVGILTGVVWSVLKLPMPVILEKTVKCSSACNTARTDGDGSIDRVQRSFRKYAAGDPGRSLKADDPGGRISADRSDTWFPDGKADRNPCDARLGDNGQFLFYGKKYGA